MNENNAALKAIQHPPPWILQGDAFLLNYWLSSAFIEQSTPFKLSASRFGRMIQVMLVRYQHSPIGAYDELLLLDHPLFTDSKLHTIPKIYVSTQISVNHGQQYWGIPKELACFEWREHGNEVQCTIRLPHDLHNSMVIQLNKAPNPRLWPASSKILPASFLKIQQIHNHQLFQFSPSFKGTLSKLQSVTWMNTSGLFPEFSQARYFPSFYAPNFELVFPEADIYSL